MNPNILKLIQLLLGSTAARGGGRVAPEALARAKTMGGMAREIFEHPQFTGTPLGQVSIRNVEKSPSLDLAQHLNRRRITKPGTSTYEALTYPDTSKGRSSGMGYPEGATKMLSEEQIPEWLAATLRYLYNPPTGRPLGKGGQ